MVDTSLEEPQVPPDLEIQVGVKNYTSMLENEQAAQEEIDRLVEKNFVAVIDKKTLLDNFKEGTLSRLALISKQKESGTWKHRIITDLLRSGGNERSVVPERIVLPRISDFVQGVQRLWSRQTEQTMAASDWAMELIGADLADAYCHFAVAPEEICNCVSPAVAPDEFLVFKSMMFGYKAAPLIMGRLSAMMGRQWQSFLRGH